MSSTAAPNHFDQLAAQSLFDAWCSAFNDKNAAALRPLLRVDAQLVNVLGQRMVGADAVVEAHTQLYKVVKAKLAVQQVEVRILESNVLLAHCAWDRFPEDCSFRFTDF